MTPILQDERARVADALVTAERAEHGLPPCDFESLPADHQKRYLDRATAAMLAFTPDPAIGSDMVMVPREPTREMWAAGGNAVLGHRQRHHDKVVEDVWSGMLAAAPAIGSSSEGEVKCACIVYERYVEFCPVHGLSASAATGAEDTRTPPPAQDGEVAK